jgi:hypothetical protein
MKMKKRSLVQLLGSIIIGAAGIGVYASDSQAACGIPDSCNSKTSTSWTEAVCCDSPGGGFSVSSWGSTSGGTKFVNVWCNGTCSQAGNHGGLAHGLTSSNTKVCETSNWGGTTSASCPSSAVKTRVFVIF